MARRRYGPGRALIDILLVFMTGGLWLIWMLVRALRNNM